MPTEYDNGPTPIVPKPNTVIGIVPDPNYIIVYAPPPERRSESGLHLDQAESLDANLPLRGKVVATPPWSGYEVGMEVLIRRYAGIQAEIGGDVNFYFLRETAGEILGRFDKAPLGTSEG